MFTVQAPDTFKAVLTIVGHGREQKLNLTYRHFDADGYQALFKSLAAGEKTPVDALLELVAEWDADVALDAAGIRYAEQQQIGLVLAIIQGYHDSIAVARKGN